MRENFEETLERTLDFNAEEPNCETRESALRACEAFSIGYERFGPAKSLSDKAFLSELVSLDTVFFQI